MLGRIVKEVLPGTGVVARLLTLGHNCPRMRAPSVENYNAASVETGCEGSGQLSRKSIKSQGLSLGQ